MASVRDINIRELKQLAKKRDLNGYSEKNEDELVRLLESQDNPLDQPVQDINVSVLTPQPPSKKVQRFKEYAADKRQIFETCKLQME